MRSTRSLCRRRLLASAPLHSTTAMASASSSVECHRRSFLSTTSPARQAKNGAPVEEHSGTAASIIPSDAGQEHRDSREESHSQERTDVRPRRPPTEADRLARDIADLGKQRWESRAKGRLSIPAHVLSEAAAKATPASGASSSPAPPAKALDAAKVAFQLSKARTAKDFRNATFASIPGVHHSHTAASARQTPVWEPQYQHLPSGSMGGSLGADIIPNMTDIAYTLDEVENSLFNSAGDDDPPPGEGATTEPAEQGSEKTALATEAPSASELASHMVTTDDARLAGQLHRPSAHAQISGTPQQESPPAEESKGEPRGNAQEANVPRELSTEAASTSVPDSIEQHLAYWVSPHIPCCFHTPVMQLDTKEDVMQGLRSGEADKDGALLSIRFDPSSASFVMSPKRPVQSVRELITSLNEALSWLEVRHLEAARQHGKRAGQRDQRGHVTNVMLHVSSATVSGWREASTSSPTSPEHVVVTSLQPVESELSLSVLERLNLSKEKERLLRRLATSVSRGLRITAVVGGQTIVTDVVAELLLCCHDCYMVGSMESTTVGFPSVAYGVLPSPSTLTVLRRRVEHVMSNHLAKEKLLTALQATGPVGLGLLGVVAPSPEEVLTALVPRLHTATAAFWGELGLWDSVPVHTTVATAWWQLSLDRVWHQLVELVSRRKAPTPPASALGNQMWTVQPTPAVLWPLYVTAACHAEQTGLTLAWRELLMRTLDTHECHSVARLYQQARSSMDVVTVSNPQHVVYLTRGNLPDSLDATALREALAGADATPQITLVFDADVPAAEKERLLAGLRASMPPVDARATEGVNVTLVGEPSTLAGCASLMPLVAVLSPVGKAVSRGAHCLRAASDALPSPTLLLNSLFEVALLPVPNQSAAAQPQAEEPAPPSLALVHAQAGAVQFLEKARLPFILSTSGEEGLRLVARLVLDLHRAKLAEPLVLVSSILASLEQRLAFSEPISQVLLRYAPDRILRHVNNVAKEGMRREDQSRNVTLDELTQLYHQLAVDREVKPIHLAAGPSSPFASAVTYGVLRGDQARVSALSQGLLLSMVDWCATALLHGTLCNASDVNLLSVAALSVAPTSGGVLASVDRHIHGHDWEPLLLEMELCAGQTGHHFLSLPLLRWMSQSRVRFAQLDAQTLQRARADLLKS